MIGTILSLVLAIVTFTISICSWMEKGFLFNNAYIFASEEERKTMNKRPYYRQSAIVFCLLGVLFLLIALRRRFRVRDGCIPSRGRWRLPRLFMRWRRLSERR